MDNHEYIKNWYINKPKDPDWDPKFDTNNFYCNFPGGYRYEKCSKTRSKITKTIEILLDEFSIDGKQVCEEISNAVGMICDGINLIKNDPEKAKEVLELGEKMRNQGLKKIYPIFHKMIELGFDENELKS